jgi:hypothetical protein
VRTESNDEEVVEDDEKKGKNVSNGYEMRTSASLLKKNRKPLQKQKK